ncbi:sulfotransferase family 2 domain-containing protein [Winogradskyella helgolandensis]|uniref:sulfotransferase family 2 domain-containing protein n=1 Tax=Winogradskyella helgolandensis TaxID=2697010 RepID=UPI0015B9EFFE|nr:sulfotransferase family 2 domain-containing protein [Winogradskyella helgolandensis]
MDFIKRLEYFYDAIKRKKIKRALDILVYADFPVLFKKREKDIYLKKIIYPTVEKTSLLFVHIPKAAGSSVQNGIYGLDSWTHHTFRELCEEIPSDVVSSSYKFTFTRNPYARLYSAFNYLKKGGNNSVDNYWTNKYLKEFNSFEDFVLNWVNTKNTHLYFHFIPQYEFVIDANGDIGLDFMGKFETLKSDYEKLIDRFPGIKSLPELNINNSKGDYTEYYTKEMAEIVYNVYKMDFDTFNYPKNSYLKNE